MSPRALAFSGILVPCVLQAGLFLYLVIALQEGGVIGSRADGDKCTIGASGPQMGNSFNWADKEIGVDQIIGG